MGKFLVCVAVVIAVAALFVACQKKEETPTVETAAKLGPPEIPIEGDAVRGLELFNDTSLGTTGKGCVSCHPNGGQEGMKMEGMTTKPLIGVKDRYPGPFPMMPDKGDMKLEQVVNACLTGPVGGEPFIEDGRDMADMIAYLNGL